MSDPVIRYILENFKVSRIVRDMRGGGFYFGYSVSTPNREVLIPIWPWTNWKNKVEEILHD